MDRSKYMHIPSMSLEKLYVLGAVSLLTAGVSGCRLEKHQHYPLLLLAMGQRSLSLVDIYKSSREIH